MRTTTRLRFQSPSRGAGRRNRKLHAEKLKVPARVTVIGVALVMAGLCFLLLCTRTEAIAQQIKTEEQNLEELRRRVAAEEVRWNDMTGPRSLRAALARHNLQMGWPRPDQIIQIRNLALWESNAGNLNVYGRLDSPEGRSAMP